jgi:hypothetical protein
MLCHQVDVKVLSQRHVDVMLSLKSVLYRVVSGQVSLFQKTVIY